MVGILSKWISDKNKGENIMLGGILCLGQAMEAKINYL